MLLLFQFSDPYVKVELFSANRRVAKKKTRVKKKTVNPKFAQTFTFDLGGKLALDHMTLMFTVLVQDSSGCHERIGQVVLSTAAGDGPEFDHWSQVICNPHCPIDQWHMIHEQSAGAIKADDFQSALKLGTDLKNMLFVCEVKLVEVT